MRALPLLAALLLAAPIACSSSSSDAPPGDAGPPGTAGAGGAAGSGGSGGGPATSDAAPDTRPRPDTGGTPDTAGDPFAGCTKDPGAGDPGLPTPTDGSDPVVGGSKNFTLEKALTAFPPGGGVLTAAISTELGTIVCRLRDAKAPITVANFIGLARGTRPFRTKTGEWKRDRFYDGLLWHRVIPGFVIQGGDPDGRGTGGPGYSLPNENHAPEPEGTLAMAASDVPSGSQFYIVVGRGPKPDYNVFGSCTTDVANKIAEVDRSPADRPVTPVHMQKIEILRCPEG